MTHAEHAERLLEEAGRYAVHSPARASYLAEAQVRAQLALIELARPQAVELVADPAPAVEAEPEKPAAKRRRATTKPTQAAE